MSPLLKVGFAAGSLLALYAALGRKSRFLGDKVDVGDEVAVPVALLPAGTLSSGVFGELPNQQFGRILGVVKDAGTDVLSVAPVGMIIANAAGVEQRVVFPRQGFLAEQHVLISVPRSAVVGITRGGKVVLA